MSKKPFTPWHTVTANKTSADSLPKAAVESGGTNEHKLGVKSCSQEDLGFSVVFTPPSCLNEKTLSEIVHLICKPLAKRTSVKQKGKKTLTCYLALRNMCEDDRCEVRNRCKVNDLQRGNLLLSALGKHDWGEGTILSFKLNTSMVSFQKYE